MSKEEKAQPLKTTATERLTAFYTWAKDHEFTIKDMEAILVSVIIQTNIQGFKNEITMLNRDFEITVRELLPKEEKASKTEKESK